MSVLPEKPSTILLADPDSGSAAALGNLLKSWNYRVEILADGATAFKRFNGPQAPAMAIVDYELPSMKGFELIAETHRRSRRQAPWLMLMSGDADLEKIEMATKAGVDDFLLKPINEIDYSSASAPPSASSTSITNCRSRWSRPILRVARQPHRPAQSRSHDAPALSGNRPRAAACPAARPIRPTSWGNGYKSTVLEKPYYIHRNVLNVTASIDWPPAAAARLLSFSAKPSAPSATPNSPAETASAASANR